MTFAATRSVDPRALNGISEMSSPGEYPSRARQKRGAVGRGPEWDGGVQQEGREASSKQVTSHWLFRKVSLTGELGQDDFGRPCVVLAVQTFSFLSAASS